LVKDSSFLAWKFSIPSSTANHLPATIAAMNQVPRRAVILIFALPAFYCGQTFAAENPNSLIILADDLIIAP
jgi:hypothetical protein